MNVDAIPLELRERPQWVLWRTEDRDGKPTKVPCRTDGRRASSTDANTWTTFDAALAASSEADGVGFVFSKDDPYVGIDLDDFNSDAAAIVTALGSYTETSVSGRGAHVIVRGSLNGHPRNRKGTVEIYGDGRYFVMTGDHMKGTPPTIEHRQTELEEVLGHVFGPLAHTAAPVSRPLELDDEVLLERARSAKHGASFARLWSGDAAGYPSASEADLALCNLLAFWTGGDPARVDHLFRRSGLMRDKWDGRRGESTYGAQTIARALEGRTEFYDWSKHHLPPRPEEGGKAATGDGDTFAGHSHAEVLAMEFGDDVDDLVSALVPRGVLMIVAGLPETHKSWLALQIADAVARGQGDVLGCSTRAQGPVAYFWQDDSTRNEAKRVQLYARVRETPGELPIRWFLNEGLALPRDLARLRATIEQHGFVLVIVDSWYNVAAELDLKDREPGAIFARIKSEICDPTGCTVLVVDHMPWATETNRKRLRSYGDVFKGAAARAGIYVDAEGTKLYVEARGNNIAGFKRTPAYWDEESLELRLVDVQQVNDEERQERVLEYLADHAGESTTKVETGVKGRADSVREALKTLEEAGRVTSRSSRDLGRGGTGTYWFLSADAPLESVPLPGTGADEAMSQGHSPSARPTPYRGRAVGRTGANGADEGALAPALEALP